MEALHWMRWFIIAHHIWPTDSASLKASFYTAFNTLEEPGGWCPACTVFRGEQEKLREED